MGIREIFSESPSIPRNDALREKESIIRYIYENSAYFRQGNPALKIYYVTTGKWENDSQLVARIDAEIVTLEDLNIFLSVPLFEPVDARKLQNLFNRSQNSLTKKLIFAKKVTVPSMDGMKEAHLGYIPAINYLKLITDENDNLLRSLFYENVRDFQGDNPVNKEIQGTLQSELKDAFVLLNNGVTIVAEDSSLTSDTFTLTDFQIVNGCQTSHVLYNNRHLVTENIYIPIKLIVGPTEDLKNQVIKATNRQTVVKTEELSALTDFQKSLELFYEAIPAKHRLFYERRSNQYRSTPGMEKIRIIGISSQIRSFASMFLGRAHLASRYYGTLLKNVESNIFIDGHFPIGYYVSAYALFRLEFFFRRRLINNSLRPFKYHILAIFRMVVAGYDMPAMTANKFENYCESIKNVLWDEDASLKKMTESVNILDTIFEQNYDRDKAKDSTVHQKAALILESKSNLSEVKSAL